MLDEYEFYQGAVLRRLIVDYVGAMLTVKPFVREGRITAFTLNSRVGIYIKHSTKRMSPWRFTFSIEQAADLLDLEARCPDSYVIFVCGTDGLVALDVGRLHQIVSFEDSEHAWLRIERPPRAQYRIGGNKGELPGATPRGISLIHETMAARAKEYLSARK